MMREIQNCILVESEVPRVKSYLGLKKARSEQESAVCYISCLIMKISQSQDDAVLSDVPAMTPM